MKSKVLLFLLLPILGQAQNLVPNGSFEEYVNCPESLGDGSLECAPWISSLLTCDYFNECQSGGEAGVPNNQLAYQNSFEGNAYCGLVTYDLAAQNREVLSIQLSAPLLTGQVYYYSFKVSMGDKELTDIASNNLGIKFTEDLYSTFDEWVDNNAHAKIDTLFTDSVNWCLFSGSVTPLSNYNYLSIGNFFTDTNTITSSYNEDIDRYSYCLIDDVRLSTDSIFGLGTTYINETSTDLINIWPTVTSDMIYINKADDCICEIYSSNGKCQRICELDKATKFLDVSGLSTGFYLLFIYGKNGDQIIQKFIKI